jgi:predicted DNA-binding transcriptional regulator AlpA
MRRVTLPLAVPAAGLPSAAPGDKPKRRRRRLSPLVADAKLLARLLGGVGVRSIRAWDAAGKLPRPIRLGSRVVWLISEIRDFLAAGAPDRQTWEQVKKRKR